jgi:hypothetical protein
MCHKSTQEPQHRYCLVRFAFVAVAVLVYVQPGLAQDPLPSWNDTAPKISREYEN